MEVYYISAGQTRYSVNFTSDVFYVAYLVAFLEELSKFNKYF